MNFGGGGHYSTCNSAFVQTLILKEANKKYGIKVADKIIVRGNESKIN